MIELQLMSVYQAVEQMKVSLGISVLMINVTIRTETSLRPSSASVRSLETQRSKAAEVSTDNSSALGTNTFDHLPRYFAANQSP